MELHLKSLFVDHWKVLFFLAQWILLVTVSFRNDGSLLKSVLNSAASKLAVKVKREASQKLDGLSHLVLHVFCVANVTFLFSLGFANTYYLYTSFLMAFVVTLSLLTLWFLDYLLLLVSTANVTFSASSLRFGNVLWYLFGFFVFGINFILTFNKGGFIPFELVCLGIFVLFLLVKVLKGFLSALTNGFPWYYLILYFCTVYVVPMMFVKKWIGSNWLELLTI